MRSALQRINLAYVLNPGAHMAMSRPIYRPAGGEKFNDEEKLLQLFRDYRLPVIWKPVVYPGFDKTTGVSALYANGILLLDRQSPPKFQFDGLWRYDVDANKWSWVEVKTHAAAINSPQKRQVYSREHDQEVLELTKGIGLLWVRWKEDDRETEAFVFAGPILCNDVMLGPEPSGMVAVCVPFADHAKAMFVPDPHIHCNH
jgi:hypothetical protein